jgi:hypothetical protein
VCVLGAGCGDSGERGRAAHRKPLAGGFPESEHSSGVGILMMCHAKLKKAGGAWHLVGVQGMVEEALAMTSVNKIVPLYSTIMVGDI